MRLAPLQDEAHESQYKGLATQAFCFPESYWEKIVGWAERRHMRVLLDDETVLGGVAVYHMGQWFGGQRLPMGGYALVVTRVDRRGEGVAYQMMAASLRELAKQLPLAALYASTQYLYRKVGFEQAGSANRYAAPITSIGRATVGDVQPVEPRDHDQFREIHRAYARQNQGCLDRTEGLWARLTRDEPHKVDAFVHRDAGRPTGYLIFDQRPTQLPAWPRHSKQTELYVRDMVALTPSAYESILALIAGHRSMVDLFSWVGPAADPWLMRCGENQAMIGKQERWMLRMLNVREALALRGYTGGDGEVHLEVTDDLIDANHGRFVLSVSAGTGTVREGGNGAVCLDVGALASLFSGYATAETLAAVGRCQATDADDLAQASRLFRTSEPWMVDHF